MNARTPRGTDPIGVGSHVKRREDRPLLTGEATFTADLGGRGTVHMAVLRSRYAHARIEGIDATGARSSDGVLGVYTAADVQASGVPGVLPPGSPLPGPGGSAPITVRKPLAEPDRPLLPAEVVRYAGEPIAVAVAESKFAAHDAVDRIEVDYDRLTAVTDPLAARGDDAPAVHDDVPDNLAFDWECGDAPATGAAFEEAPHVVEVEFDRQRVIPDAIEPRSALAAYAPSTGELTVWRQGQGPHKHQHGLSTTLGLPENKVRVHIPNVGGSFGSKSKPYPAETLAAWCSMELGRPVKWEATRSESHVSDAHGRAHATRGELAVDDDGTFLGLRVESAADMGAFVCGPAPTIHTSSFTSVLSGQYAIPAIHCRIRGVYTTTTPVSSYRGTSRPVAALVLERLVDLAARRVDLDPAAIRRRNFVPPEAFPYETPIGPVYDNGDYAEALALAQERADYERARERGGDRDGTLFGVGIACALDEAGGTRSETARIRFHPSGSVTVSAGTKDTGQGHETTYAQLLSDELGVPFEDVAVREGDSADLPNGKGTSGSRSAIVVDALLHRGAERLIDRGREVAAHLLEVEAADVEFDEGEFFVRGVPDRSIPIQEVARRTYAGRGLPDDVEPRFETTVSLAAAPTFPFAAHVAFVEVDAESGEVELTRYVAVDDCGTQINPQIVEGQIVGGVGQGIGQALMEGAEYDDAGTLLTGSLQDYALPRATDTPDVETETTVTPSPRTPGGVKGIGESGTTAAPAAIANAVMDALAPLGVEGIQLPITDETVWAALRSADADGG